MRASSRTLRAKWRLWHLLRAAISIEDVVERVAAWRGRPIQVLAFAFPQGELSGMWLALNGLDVVVFPQDASPLRRVAIIGHELGHMLLGHSPGDASCGNTTTSRPLSANHMPDSSPCGNANASSWIGRPLQAATRSTTSSMLIAARSRCHSRHLARRVRLDARIVASPADQLQRVEHLGDHLHVSERSSSG